MREQICYRNVTSTSRAVAGLFTVEIVVCSEGIRFFNARHVVRARLRANLVSALLIDFVIFTYPVQCATVAVGFCFTIRRACARKRGFVHFENTRNLRTVTCVTLSIFTPMAMERNLPSVLVPSILI